MENSTYTKGEVDPSGEIQFELICGFTEMHLANGWVHCNTDKNSDKASSDSLTGNLFSTCSESRLNVSLRVCSVMNFHPSHGNESAIILFLKQSHAFNEL